MSTKLYCFSLVGFFVLAVCVVAGTDIAKRIVCKSYDTLPGTCARYYVLVDTKTGIEYLVVLNSGIIELKQELIEGKESTN